MTELVRPDVRYHASWAEAVAEFGRRLRDARRGLWDFDTSDSSEQALKPEVERTCSPRPTRPPSCRESWVHCTYFWIADGGGVRGLPRAAARADAVPARGGWPHRVLGPPLPPPRGPRHPGAGACAAAGVRGWDWTGCCVTCDDDNEGSRLTIERNGGVYEDTRKGKRRYWIDARVTSRAATLTRHVRAPRLLALGPTVATHGALRGRRRPAGRGPDLAADTGNRRHRLRPGQPNLTPGPSGYPGNDLGIAYTSPWWVEPRASGTWRRRQSRSCSPERGRTTGASRASSTARPAAFASGRTGSSSCSWWASHRSRRSAAWFFSKRVRRLMSRQLC